MVEVVLWASLRRLADDRESVEVDAETVKDVLKGLVEQYPALRPHLLDRGVSVSVDGQMVISGWNEKISANSEVVLLQRIKGG